jgi:GntR family transcriptional regulator/MocR family aminotransferase
MARRLALLAWARKAGAFIVEDDYVSKFRYSSRPLAALQGLDEDERVIYVGTLNKALFPGLRIGYAVVSEALLQAYVAARYLIDRQPPTLHQAVVAEFMREGYFAAHIRRMRLMTNGGEVTPVTPVTPLQGNRGREPDDLDIPHYLRR